MTDANTPSSLLVAVAQMSSGDDVAQNHAVAERLVREAATRGAGLVVLPERWHFIHDDARVVQAAEALDGPSLSLLRDLAAELGVAIVAGSIAERISGAAQVYNTSALIDERGEVAAVYRKLHLFDVDVGGASYRESAATRAGDHIAAGVAAGCRIGLTICYDLRFPELYRRLTLDGAALLVVPAAFTATTGPDHWEVLLRARAIENQAVVVAANQWGTHAHGAGSHGRSMIVDAWGVVRVRAVDRTEVVLAHVDFADTHRIRERLPALGHRRADVYGDPDGGPAPAV